MLADFGRFFSEDFRAYEANNEIVDTWKLFQLRFKILDVKSLVRFEQDEDKIRRI